MLVDGTKWVAACCLGLPRVYRLASIEPWQGVCWANTWWYVAMGKNMCLNTVWIFLAYSRKSFGLVRVWSECLQMMPRVIRMIMVMVMALVKMMTTMALSPSLTRRRGSSAPP